MGTAGRSHPVAVVFLVLGLALGQTVDKLLFEAARHGGGRCGRWLARRKRQHGEQRSDRWGARVTDALGSRRTGSPLVLLSASLGLPPLAVVSLAAGASGQRRWEFAALCLLGRTTRFAVLALPVAYALS